MVSFKLEIIWNSLSLNPSKIVPQHRYLPISIRPHSTTQRIRYPLLNILLAIFINIH
jgi:hypothetical protein